MKFACTSSETFDFIKQKFPKDDIVKIEFNYVFDQYHLLRFTWETRTVFDVLIIDLQKFKNDLFFSSILFESKNICKKISLVDDDFFENDYKEILINHYFKKVEQVDELVYGSC